jgi:ATP-dependent DNA ligase
VQLYAFDITLDGEDLHGLPLTIRNLAHLLARLPDGIFVAPFEQGEIGPDLSRATCDMVFEGLVSKRRDRPYQAGRSKHWINVKITLDEMRDSCSSCSRFNLFGRRQERGRGATGQVRERNLASGRSTLQPCRVRDLTVF